MKTIELGRTGLRVSRIGLGAAHLGTRWAHAEPRTAIAGVRRARELGINLFNTAHEHGGGQANRLLGRALRVELDLHRERLVIATRGGWRAVNAGRRWLRAAVERDLRGLGTDYIDLYQVYSPPGTTDEELAEQLAELRDAGLVRHIGLSTVDRSRLAAIGDVLGVQAIALPYSLLHRPAEGHLLPYARWLGIGVLAYGTLGHGLLGGQLTRDTVFSPEDWRPLHPMFQGTAFTANLRTAQRLNRLAREYGTRPAALALAWVLARPAVHAALVGTRQPAHLDELAAALSLDRAGTLRAEVHRALATVPGTLVTTPGTLATAPAAVGTGALATNPVPAGPVTARRAMSTRS